MKAPARSLVLSALVALAATPAAAQGETIDQALCRMIESAAVSHRIPVDFFTRLIWQESSFRPAVTSGAGAQGVAQFMPGTAAERRLADPFDPEQALPKSAELLSELRERFGNLGLAAAAYNAGPRRVRDWINAHGSLPAETRDYVIAITGHSAEDWAAATRGHENLALTNGSSCGELMAMLKEPPSPFLGELERRVREGTARPWGVQLSAGFGRDRVLAAYATAEKSYRAILENRDPIIIETKLRSRGTQTFYQVRVGTDTRPAANDLCDALRRVGGACLVLRNWEGKPQSL
jgi:hypothetical protein